MHHIICLNVGPKYSHAYTIALWHAVRQRVTRPYRFVCYTDKPASVPNYIETRPIPHGRPANGWWSKLALFDDPEIPEGSPSTFVDLDMLLGPGFESMLDIDHSEDFRILNDFAHIGKPNRFQSAVYTWSYGKGNTRDIHAAFCEDHNKCQYASDQEFLQSYFKNRNLPYRYFDLDQVFSYKWDIEKGKALTRGWQTVAFHGNPNPPDVLGYALALEHWAPCTSLESYRNAHAGKRAELLLTGPSLELYTQDRSMVSFGVNSIAHENGWEIDHYVIQDPGSRSNPRSYNGSPEVVKNFSPHVMKWFGDWGMAGEATGREGIIPTETGGIISQGHYIIENPEGAPPFREGPPFGTNGNIAMTALQLIAFMGFKEVHVVGADIQGGRVNEPGTEGNVHADSLELYWRRAASFLEGAGIRLVMVNPVGLSHLPTAQYYTKPNKSVPNSPQILAPKSTSPMRFHLLAPPYSATSEDYLLCAYTQKVLKWMRMMEPYGYEVHHYGHPDSTCPDYVNHHDVIFDSDWRACGFGSRGDWREVFFDAQNAQCRDIYNERTKRALTQNVRPKDFILHFWGGTRDAARHLEDVQIVEPGIGYTSTFATFKVFESLALLNEAHGRKGGDRDPWGYDTVIPNYFDAKDFEFLDNPTDDYLLYLGRITRRKGLDIVCKLAAETDLPVLIAGQGELERSISVDAPDNVVCVGYADLETRKKLMSNAKALLAPTLYNEPFGGVAVEAMLSGTPVIASANGAFPETVTQGVGGYTCRTFSDYIKALRRIEAGEIKRETVRANAERYLLPNVAPLYHDYFTWLLDVAHNPKDLWWTKAGAAQS